MAEAPEPGWFDSPESVALEAAPGQTYLDAINLALDHELASDERVVLLGEDIGVMGGAFRVTRGLYAKYGARRVIDTPMAEAALVGMAIGMAISGLRPIVELQFADFISCAYDQLVNEAAKLHYRFGIAVPLVVRCPSGGGVGAGPFHSQSPEGTFAHIPGLKVVCPGTVQDAYGLLRASVADPNPVLFFEHKALYRSLKDHLDPGIACPPIGKAVVRKSGDRLTLVTFGGLYRTCEIVAGQFEAEGVAIELIDLRSLLPMDVDTIATSVRKTGRVLIVHEDTISFGAGAEVAARLADEVFFDLDAPIRRVAAPDCPIPLAKPLEEAFIPNQSRIHQAIEDCLAI